jgi:hypothetical protein
MPHSKPVLKLHSVKTTTAACCGAAPLRGVTGVWAVRIVPSVDPWSFLGRYRFTRAKPWRLLSSKGDGAARSGERGTYDVPPPGGGVVTKPAIDYC